MHRVKAHNVVSGDAKYIDLDASPLITSGKLNQHGPDGRTVVQVWDCTLVYLSVQNPDTGRFIVECVRETPEELLALPNLAKTMPAVEQLRTTSGIAPPRAIVKKSGRAKQ